MERQPTPRCVRRTGTSALFATALSAGALLALGAAVVVDAAGARRPGQPVDPWQQYVAAERWREGQEHFRAAVVALARSPAGLTVETLAPLHYGYSVCRYFAETDGRLDRDAARRLRAWMLANGDFTQTLLLALSPEDSPARAFQIMYMLLSDSAEAVLEFPELAIAFAVVWDGNWADDDLLLDAFRYYTDNAADMQFNLSTVPYEITKYLVDSTRPIGERLWALDRYAGTDNIGRLYDRIWLYRYDRDAYYGRAEPELAGLPLTLENIREHGGVCADAALFASEVGKAVGVPSVYIRGPSPSGIEHAWVGFVRGGARRAKWDRDTGRIGQEEAVTGVVRDPQSGAAVPEHELDFALAALRCPAGSRRAAKMWLDAARILAEAGTAPEARAAMYESLNACVYDKVQWREFARLAKQGVFGPQDVIAAMSTFVERLADYPGLAVDAFAQLTGAYESEDPMARVRLCDQMADRFESRDHDVLGRIWVLKGRYLEDAGEADEALRVYSDGALDVLGNKTVALGLLGEASRLLLARDALAEAISLHRAALARTPRPQTSRGAPYSTWAHVALRLAKLYELAGDVDEHDELLEDIVDLQPIPDDAKDAVLRRLKMLDYGTVDRRGAIRAGG
jgi:tetratricopeptide (TPR) repeat protein